MSCKGAPALWALRLIFSGACLGWMAFIFQVSSFSPPEVNETFVTYAWLGPFRDIVGHLALYGVLASLLQFCIWAWLGSITNSVRWALAAVAIAMLYGISDEFHQSMVPGRTATMLDVLVNTLGALLAVAVLTGLANVVRKWLNSHGKSLASD